MVTEANFRTELKHSYEKHYGNRCYAISMASMYIPGGLPDLVLCLDGKFTAIECKFVKALPKNKDRNMLKYGFTRLQAKRAQDVVAAGGVALGVICIRPLKIAVIVPAELMREDLVLTENTLAMYSKFIWSPERQMWAAPGALLSRKTDKILEGLQKPTWVQGKTELTMSEIKEQLADFSRESLEELQGWIAELIGEIEKDERR